MAIAIPLLTILLGSLRIRGTREYFILIHVSILAFALSLFVTGFITNFLKVFIGRPRPDFIARCAPNPDTPKDGLVTSAVCTETDAHKLEDGFKSFPSGHSSIAFSAFYFLSLWMAGQLSVFSQQSKMSSKANSLKAFVCILPILLASYVSISRTEDYRHRFSDILAGAIIGIIMSWICYRLYFPRLADIESNIPCCMYGTSYRRELDLEEGNPNENVFEGSTSMFPQTNIQDDETAYRGSSYSHQPPVYSSNQPARSNTAVSNNSVQSIELTAMNRSQ